MIGAYYQCFNQDKSLNFVLTNYRKFYNNTNIVLVCDGGSDYSSEALKYNCHYHYEKKINTEKNLIFKSIDSTFTFFERLGKFINEIDEDFFIILEDDVLIMNKITISHLQFDINGCNVNEFLSENINNDLKNYNKNYNLDKFYFGGCGGSILKTIFF